MRKSLEWWGQNKKETKTHHHRLLKVTSEQGMVATSYYLPGHLKEGSQCGRRDSNLIENGCGEKHWEWWGEIKKRQKLTIAAFSKRLASGGWRQPALDP